MELASNGSHFHCQIDGKEDAPTIVLSHGLATDLHMWDDVVPALAREYRVFRYDARGHGRSPATPAPYSLSELGADVIGLLDAADLGQVHFVGLSMGGMVGMGLGVEHGDRLASLTVCDARGHAPPQYRDAWAGRCDAVRQGGIEAMVEPSVSRWFTPAFQSRPDDMERMRQMVRRTSSEGYCGCAMALRDLDYERRLPELKVPTLYLVGDGDNGAPPEVMAKMHAATPGSQYIEIAEAGHMSAVEQPEAFAEAILQFLNDTENNHNTLPQEQG